ncbi:hypothetical protein TNCV_1762401 [Trichonephila clavipes]|nr:hypothetical protein TNCV_1762401 [Trichonephila clavipes]
MLHEWQHMWLQDVMNIPLGRHGATDHYYGCPCILGKDTPYHYTSCGSSGHIRMVREDTGAPIEGATCAWMAADEAVALRVHLVRCGGLLYDWSVEGVLRLIFV